MLAISAQGQHANLLCIIPVLTDVKGVICTREYKNAPAEFPPLSKTSETGASDAWFGREEDEE